MNDRPAEPSPPDPPADDSPPLPGLHAELGETMPGAAPQLHPVLAEVSPLDESHGGHYEHDDYHDEPPRRWVMRPILLFIATCLSTFWAGATGFLPLEILSVLGQPGGPQVLRQTLLAHWHEGLIYMGCVLAILLAHEMGHFLTSLYYRVHASLPFFIPIPISPIGTMGAVIAMDGSRANRRQLFDIGIAGPLAGLVVALPVLWIGVAQLDLASPAGGVYQLGLPPIAKMLLAVTHPEVFAQGRNPVVLSGQLNPYFMAGWVGMFVTGINMMPLSQLDGGHVLYGLSPRRARTIARTFLIFAIVFSVLGNVWQHWGVMLLLITLLGVDHPPTANDRMPLGAARTVLGLASWLIPLLCFPVDAISSYAGK